MTLLCRYPAPLVLLSIVTCTCLLVRQSMTLVPVRNPPLLDFFVTPMTAPTKRPRFIIHVGPPKTSSNTLQHDLREHKYHIQADNYINLGKWRGHYPDKLQETLMSCPGKLDAALEEGLELAEVECYQDFLYYLSRQAGRSIILTDELFAGMATDGRSHWFQHLPTMRRYFLNVIERERDVLVVAVYRRYAEWLLSAKKQRDAKECIGDRVKGWPSDWPSDGGRACDPIWPSIMATTKNLTQFQSAFRYESPYHVLDAWKELGVKTFMMNMHEKKSITVRLLCDILGDLPYTCASLRARNETRHDNRRTTDRFAYDWIVFHAGEEGLIDIDQPRMEVVGELIEFHQRLNMTLVDLPLVCPGREEVHRLLQISLAMEKELLPQSTADDELVHRESFWHMYHRSDFCTPNTAVLFQDATSWDNVLRRMKQSYAVSNEQMGR